MDSRERFYQQVSQRPGESGCWLWQGSCSGVTPTFWSDGRCQSAQRVSWQLHRGEISKGKRITRTCGQWRCVRPEHLACVSPRELLKRLDCTMPRAALTLDAEHEIQRLHYAERVSIAQLCRDFGVSRRRVERVLERPLYGERSETPPLWPAENDDREQSDNDDVEQTHQAAG